MVTPSGWTRARYSPLAFKLKFACRGAPGTARFLPEANTMRNPLGGTLVAGRRHLVRLAALSVRNQPLRFAVLVPELNISIQSGVSPSSSRKPPLLEARNSEMNTGCPSAATADETRIALTNAKQRINGGSIRAIRVFMKRFRPGLSCVSRGRTQRSTRAAQVTRKSINEAEEDVSRNADAALDGAKTGGECDEAAFLPGAPPGPNGSLSGLTLDNGEAI